MVEFLKRPLQFTIQIGFLRDLKMKAKLEGFTMGCFGRWREALKKFYQENHLHVGLSKLNESFPWCQTSALKQVSVIVMTGQLQQLLMP